MRSVTAGRRSTAAFGRADPAIQKVDRSSTKNLKTDLAEELAERVQVSENGRLLKISKQRLMLKALTTKAIKGRREGREHRH